ncbi:protein fem-1 homolog B-like [Leptopilina boulardi]|uniref:protein fem-1 homolog B-like n=1 Tax=Leptopilina boulardi TaxID=63433 RepID=UPI0021F646DA|nr:protein fem-1 homolog B-like [Leptopilina boulardi]XP_051154345.1 protein fem-1 homolog B-like [Leptopilina boulardi]XP_051154352.1 protein fem-1 homolog B-like [Leptopilina boulardi]XP_051154363.1 protein fem-1 homolog B-like [Leptopilina boulardi]
MTMTFQTDSTLEMAEKTNVSLSLMNRVYYAARDGMAITLYALLSEKTSEQIGCLINQKVLQDDGQRCTPLIVASRYGNDRVVKMLIDKFKPDLEEEGTVKFDGFAIEGASALWCAAGAGHLGVVKTLVKAGADVNHPTKTNSTPLRAACFNGRLDIVKYLTDHQANIHMANKYNNTCLMIAAYKGHLDVVSFLLENGADPNERAHCGATALHFASECDHCKIVSELLKHGTKMTKNVSGMTPLMVAAERTRRHVVECLVTREEVTKEDLIDAYELLGASYANDKDNYCLRWAYLYLLKAMDLRFSDPNNIIRKKRSEPVSAYENWRECENLQQLESIKDDSNSLHMESLVIRERILGTHNPEVPHPIVYRGAVFADAARFDRCIDLWLRALHLRQLNNISVVKDLLRFAQVFSQMIHVGVELQFAQVLNVLEASVTELERNKTKINNPEPKDDVDQSIVSKDEMESNITTTLYIMTILTKLITLNEREKDKIDLRKAHYLVHKLCALNVTLRDGQTILHLAVNAETPVDDFHTNDVCKFPCASTAKLLIQCGADVNAMDSERNTPLHVIVSYEKPISDFLTLHAIIMGLIEAGAHMDTVNSQGKTPYESATTGVADIILRTQTKLSLKCMAAKVVKTYNLSYCGSVPQSLESFIELHGSGLNQG